MSAASNDLRRLIRMAARLHDAAMRRGDRANAVRHRRILNELLRVRRIREGLS